MSGWNSSPHENRKGMHRKSTRHQEHGKALLSLCNKEKTPLTTVHRTRKTKNPGNTMLNENITRHLKLP
jgi:hypothetical protein